MPQRMFALAWGLLTAALFAGSLMTTPTQAQTLTVAQLTAQCPDIPQGEACPATAVRFLAGLPVGQAKADRIIGGVWDTIAEASRTPKVPLKVCLNAADGLRVLAGAVRDASLKNTIIQTSCAHGGLTDDPSAALERIMATLVRLKA